MKKQSVRDWFPLLKWKKLPLFCSCHDLVEYQTFLDNYYVCEKLALLEENIIESLNTENIQNAKFMGKPGAGKTTFLYYLFKKAKHENLEFSKLYSFYVFHANRADDKNHTHLVQREIINAWEHYYKSCGFGTTFSSIVNGNRDTDVKSKANNLATYYIKNKKRFGKKFIFIVDDVDLLDHDMAMDIAKDVIKSLELVSVTKWISLREQTYTKYDINIKKFFDEFFPGIYNLPDVSLHSIISHRIKTIQDGEGINPFPKDLCDEIIAYIFEENKRRCLPVLKTILENNLPGNMEEQQANEPFIQKWISRVGLKILLQSNYLPNIHDDLLRINNYPLALDILHCADIDGNPNRMLGKLNDIAILRSNKSGLSESGKMYKISKTDFEETIKRMVDNKLITRSGQMIELTNIGFILMKNISRETYKKASYEKLQDTKDKITYIKLSEIYIDYHEISDKYLLYNNPHTSS